MSKHPFLRLDRGRDKRLKAGHPWIYSNEIAPEEGARTLEPGQLVTVTDAGGTPLGTATYNRHSLIAARLLTPKPHAAIDREFFAQRLRAARDLRERLLPRPFYRLIHSEADGLPGLIVDRFGDVFTVQLNTAGMERLFPALEEALGEVFNPRSVVLRGDTPARALEGLAPDVRVLGQPVDGPVTVEENGLTYLADLAGGQKTGWFYDQRDNRAFIASLCPGLKVLDLYSYTGSFALLAAGQGAASVLACDRSEGAMTLAAEAAVRNGLAERCRFEKADVFALLDQLTAKDEIFDVVIADPPAFVKSRKDLAAGAKGYRKLARLCAGRVAPGGLLFMASCSHHMAPDMFAAEIAHGIHAAGRSGRILRSFGAALDHPVHPHLPESAYLKSQTLQLD